jgi:hypothetical protein
VTRRELEPGFPEPATPAEVEHLLHLVPDIAFMPELRACVPARPRQAGSLSATEIDRHVDDAYRDTLRAALQRLQARAQSESRGGLAFLARTLLHFHDAEPLPASQHPLVVAMFLRGEAAAGRLQDTPAAIGRAMDVF